MSLNRKIQFFTLIELMTVIVLVGMLLSLSFPLYSSYVIGDGVNRSAESLKQEIGFCRDYSRNFQCYTAIIFPDHQVLGREHADGCRCYRSAVLIREEGEFRFLRWINESDWNYAEKGVYLEFKKGDLFVDLIADEYIQCVDQPVLSQDGCMVNNHLSSEAYWVDPLVKLKPQSSCTECICLIFSPEGKPCTSGFDVPLLHVGLGYWDTGKLIITNENDFLEITVDRESGRVAYEN